MTIDSAYADYLKADGLYVRIADAHAALWPNGLHMARMSPFATRAAAIAEGARRAAFLGGVKVQDKIVVPGRRRDLMGKVIAVKGSGRGYFSDPVAALVIGYQEQGATTTLTIVRRLG